MPPRSPASPPQNFDVDALQIYIKKLLQSTFSGCQWPNPGKLDERDRVKSWGKEVGERVKERMIQIEPHGFKYIVTVQINENLGQAGRADLRCHWEDSDCFIQEMYTNESDQIKELRKLIAENEESAWDLAWKQKITPLDRGQMQTPLKELIESKTIPFPTCGKALVPGCGRGYDAVYISSSLGLETVGMDISETAIEAANTHLKACVIPENTKITFKVADFFSYSIPDQSDKFDLCYDYTFFVALPPNLRPFWGRQMRELVKHGGYLITLIFPIDGERSGGPPYSVDTPLYEKMLQGDSSLEEWEKIAEEETTRFERKGREKIAVWRRK